MMSLGEKKLTREGWACYDKLNRFAISYTTSASAIINLY